MTPRTFERREFLTVGATVGAGLLMRLAEAESTSFTDGAAADLAPNGYLRIGRDGIITLDADHVELGQGVMAALPMIVVEELDADWNLVRIERMSDNPSAWARRVMNVGKPELPSPTATIW